jgi:hypothetical protein
MDARSIAALQSSLMTGDEYTTQLYQKARQLAYNTIVDISQNDPNFDFENIYLTADLCVNEGINTYMMARKILNSSENVKILHEEATADQMIKAPSLGPQNYPQQTNSEESVNRIETNLIGPSTSCRRTRSPRIRTKPYMRVCPHNMFIPPGFMPTPGMNVEVENANMNDPDAAREVDSC